MQATRFGSVFVGAVICVGSAGACSSSTAPTTGGATDNGRSSETAADGGSSSSSSSSGTTGCPDQPSSCGACGNICTGGDECADGSCVAPCNPGQTRCAGGSGSAAFCTDVTGDVFNCGACGNACPQGLVCTSGKCDCPPGRTSCTAADSSLACVDSTGDPKNCGACGKVCPSGANDTAVCGSGACGHSCSSGHFRCVGTSTTEATGCECDTSDHCFASGECAKLVFVTSSIYDGNLGGLAGADAKCQARATAAGLPGTFKAWLSSTTVQARNRLTHSAKRYMLVDGTVVASSWADIVDGSIAHGISLTENGTPASISYNICTQTVMNVWTGTTYDGTSDPNILQDGGACHDWTVNSGSSNIVLGDGNQSSPSWTGGCGGFSVDACIYFAHLYCFQQ